MKLKLLAALLAAASLLPATTIISTNGTPNSSSGFGSNQVMLIQFFLPTDYINVSISAGLISFDPGGTGTAYLTNQIGAGTTAGSNELASTNFNAVFVTLPSDPADVQLFSNLSLAAGTYNLVLTGPVASSGIARNNAGSYTTDPGIVVTPMVSNSTNINNTYAPASVFNTFGSNNALYFTVTGDSSVPEPSSIALLLTGAGALLWKRRRSLISNR